MMREGHPVQEGRDALLTAALALLHTSGRSWAAIAGDVRTWRDEDLLDRGRHTWRDEDPSNAGALVTTSTPVTPARQYETTHRLQATMQPWRVRMDLVRDDRPTTDGSPDTLIFHGHTWWAEWSQPQGRRTRSIMSNVGQENYTSSAGWDSLNLDLLLRPTVLPEALTYHDAAVVRINGREAIRLHGRPVTPIDAFFWKVGGFVALGADEYVVAVDAAIGVLLCAEVYIDGQLARREELMNVRVDPPTDDALFTRLSEPPSFG